jgi:hypothetical protein
MKLLEQTKSINSSRPIWLVVSKRVEWPQAVCHRNSRKAVLRVACPQDIEGLGMAGPGETLGSPWIPLPYGPEYS